MIIWLFYPLVYNLSYSTIAMIRFVAKQCFTTSSAIHSFGVVGSGQMGTGIAIVANKVAKLPVTIYDSNPISLQKSKKFIADWLKKEEAKKKITES